MQNYILTSGNDELVVTGYRGNATVTNLGGVPLGTTDGSPTAELGVKCLLIGSTAAIGTVNSTAKQLTGTPSNFTVGTTDATVFTLAAGEIGFIQNLDDAALAVKKGASASTSSLSFILAAGTAADDGKGASVIIDDWVGVVSVAAMSGSPRYVAWKQAA